MPRRVDHQLRREQLADAVMRLAATEGLEEVSLRHVAAEAGVSTGMVQHYFRTKDEMMTFALGVVMDNVQARTMAEAATLERDVAPGRLVRTVLLQILPLDEQRRLEGHVSLAFLAYAAVKPAIGEGIREGSRQMRTFLAEQISAAQDAAGAGAGPRVDPVNAATALLALVDGLGIHLLGQHYSPEEAVAALDAYLVTLFPPPSPVSPGASQASRAPRAPRTPRRSRG